MAVLVRLVLRRMLDDRRHVPTGRGAVFRAQRPGLLQKARQPSSRACAPAGDHGEEGENHQRSDHHPRRLVGMVIDVLVAGLAGKGHVPEAEHVKRRNRGPRRGDPEEIAVQRIGLAGTTWPGPGCRPWSSSRSVRRPAECRPPRSPGSRRASCRRSRASSSAGRPSPAFRWCPWRGSPTRSRGTAGP